jgi:hypothetical protein
MGGVSVVAVVLLLSFGIDRLVTGILFVLSWSARSRALCPDPAEAADAHEKAAAERRQKTAYFVFAGGFSVVLLLMVDKGVFTDMGFVQQKKPLDILLTALILMGGAERVQAFSAMLHPSADAAASEPPLHITGTLTLEEGTIRRLRGETA